MSKFSRQAVYRAMYETGIVPVFYHADLETCKTVLAACYQGGARLFEFTNRGDKAHEVFSGLIDYARAHMPALMLGAGSVLDAGTASLYIQLGADFIVSPVLMEDVVRVCNRRKIAVIPGCGSFSEIMQAQEWGVEVVKLFPARQLGGPGFIQALRGPFPEVAIMPTGGVQPEQEDIRAWVHAGAYCLGMGSQLMAQDHVGGYDAEKITARTRDCIGWVREYRISSLVVR